MDLNFTLLIFLNRRIPPLLTPTQWPSYLQDKQSASRCIFPRWNAGVQSLSQIQGGEAITADHKEVVKGEVQMKFYGDVLEEISSATPSVHTQKNNYPAGICSAGIPLPALGGEANVFLKKWSQCQRFFGKGNCFLFRFHAAGLTSLPGRGCEVDRHFPLRILFL